MPTEHRETPSDAHATPGMLTDAVVLAYAAWTIAANVVVMMGGATRALTIAAAFTLVLLGAFGAWAVRQKAWARAYVADLQSDPALSAPAPSLRSAASLLGLPALTLVLWLATDDAWLAYAGLTLSSLWLALCVLSSRVELQAGVPPAPVASRYERLGLYVLAFTCAAFTLLVVRPRSDDTFYMRMAMSVVDDPTAPLLSVNMVHGPASATLGPQPMFAPYLAHSFELLGGLVSYLTGIETARVIHLGLAPLFAWWFPFVAARLFRVIAPRHVLLATAVLVSFYFIEGSAARGFANHAFVRLWHGKAVLLTVGVPLLCVYGLRYGARPSGVRFALLALSQVVALGLSSTALWLAPVLAALSVLAGTPAVSAFPKRFGASVLSSGYVLVAGVWVFTRLVHGAAEPADLSSTADALAAGDAAAKAAVAPAFERVAEALSIVFGPERTGIALLGAAFVAAAFAPSLLGRRLLAATLVALCLAFANPLLSDLVASRVTGASTYHRVFWLLPVPVAVALVMAALREHVRERVPPAAAWAVVAVALLAFYVLAVARPVISEANQAKLVFPPELKLPARARLIAQAVCRWAPRGQHVLAPPAVSQQLPIIHRCGHPLIAADRWLSTTSADLEARLELSSYVDGAAEVPAGRRKWFLDALDRYHVDAVLVSKDAIRNARLKSLLRLADFEHVEVVDWDHLFVRTLAATQSDDVAVARAVCSQKTPAARVLAPFGVSRAVAEQRCAYAVASPAALDRATTAEAEQLLALERVTSSAGDPPDQAWFAAAIEANAVDTIVLAPSSVRRELRILLERVGLRRQTVVAGHHVFRKRAADGGN